MSLVPRGIGFGIQPTASIVMSCDATFDEESFPAHNLPGNYPSTPDNSPFSDDQLDDSLNDDSDLVDPNDTIPFVPPKLFDPPQPDPPADAEPADVHSCLCARKLTTKEQRKMT